MWSKIVIICALLLCGTALSQQRDTNGDEDYNEKDDLIYRQCLHRSTFTDEELEIARQYYINKFATALIPPKRPPCERIRVRRNFKCMSHSERLRWVNAFRQLYTNESYQLYLLVEVHARYWPAFHKTSAIIPGHIKIMNIIEQQLDKISPGLTLPYWDTYMEGNAPERSIIWDYLGRGGDRSNNYCIKGGYFENITLSREQRCIKRRWNDDGTIPRFYSPEYFTSFLQNKNFLEYFYDFANHHFKPHLFTGGFEGDMSVKTAPYDPLFWLYHNQQGYMFLQRFLQQQRTLVPVDLQLMGRYDFNLGKLGPANYSSDMLFYFSDKYVVEYYHYGYGEMCSLRDRDVLFALYETNNTRPPLPRAVERLRKSLSAEAFARLFPSFASGNYTSLETDLFEVGNRNRGPNCRKLPRVQNYTDNANNKRQLEALMWEISTDVTPLILEAEVRTNAFIEELNRSGYCSPYA